MAIQQRNDELIKMASADLQSRYESGFSWRTCVSTLMALSGLRGCWPMSIFNSTGAAIDPSGNGRTLTYNGNPLYTHRGLVPYIVFDGTGDYLSRTDEAALDITGTESYVATTRRGLTLGGWFYPTDAATAQHIMSKFSAAAGNYSFKLTLEGAAGGDPVRFYISDDGTNGDSVDSTTGYSTSVWQFFAGRFCDNDTGIELSVWNNDELTQAATARNSIFNGNADFCIAGRSGGTALYTGRASMCFLCATALDDATVWALYQQTRALFGV